jgi:biopolymer transport protein ExbB
MIARDGAARQLPVLRIGTFAAYACGADRQTCGLLRTDGMETPLVTGPYLSEPQMADLRAAAEGTIARLSVDVDGSLADRPAQEPKSIRSWLKAGGMFVYPIIFVAALGAVLVLERLRYLLSTRRSPALIGGVLERLEQGDERGAREVLADAQGPTARVMAAGVEARGKSEEERETAMESALLAEAPRLERSLSFLAALAAVAPLLGLLGTVSGMIATFNTISTAGTGNPRLLSGGISEALITTQFGLMVAIPLLLIHAWLQRWVERREAMLEYDAIQVFGLEHHEEEAIAE